MANFYTAKYDAATLNRKLKKNVLFSVHNLVSDGAFNEFQMITCRNVLIYFDQETKQRVLSNVVQRLKPGGWLMVGHSEALHDTGLPIEMVASSIYRKVAA